MKLLRKQFDCPNYSLSCLFQTISYFRRGQIYEKLWGCIVCALFSSLLDVSVPVLIKPQWTTGDPLSHAIDIILEEEGIPDSYPIDMVVQVYRNHNGVIFKVYAVEDTVFIEKRYSLPNVTGCNVIKSWWNY